MYRKAAIVGIGQTEFSRASNRSELQLALEAILAALRDAGIKPSEVDGICRFDYDNVTHPMLIRNLGIKDLQWYSDAPLGGIANSAVIAHAAAAIASGICQTVIVFRALNERSGVRYGRAEHRFKTDGDLVEAAGDKTPAGQFAGPYGLHAPGQVHALWCRRYMYEAGLTQEDLTQTLGTVAITQRQYANNNPRAIMKDRQLTWDEYRNARIIAAPLRLYDYCLETDGAVAVILTTAERAKSLNNVPVYVKSAHQCLYPHSEPLMVYAPLVGFPAPQNISKLYTDAGVTPKDIDVALFYDATAQAIPTSLETYQFAERNKGWRHILEHGIGRDSPIPVNTHGGLLSEGYVHGLNHINEGVRQLRGTAANQIPNVENVLLGCAGWSSAILGR
jgi:acetyl-CoA acetyltransferase